MGVFYDHFLFDFWPSLHSFLERHALIRAVAKVLAYVGLLVVAALVYASYEALDDHGWIPHDHDTPVWIQGDWLVGEYRDCGMLTTTPPAGVVLSQTARAELPRLFCGKNWEGEGVDEFENAMPDQTGATDALRGRGDWSPFNSYFHVLPVRFFGRVERPDSWFVSWRCQRKSDSLTCKALN
jgi:hypothetical protein